MITQKQDVNPMLVWEELEDIPMNPKTECIECDFYGFKKGTHKEEIWHWFEETFHILVHTLV